MGGCKLLYSLGVKSSAWWKDVNRLFWEDNETGLREGFVRKLGSGEGTSFWTDC